MGVNARIEDEPGNAIAKIDDPRNLFAWALTVFAVDSTRCLQFIDHYGNTLFNQAQLPTLLGELGEAFARLDERSLAASKERYLAGAAAWPATARMEALGSAGALSLSDVREQVGAVIVLVRDAVDRGPHHYVRFIGD